MPAVKKTLFDNDNEVNQAGPENELQKLQRMYRSLENDRRMLYHDAHEITRKQRLEIDALDKERQELDLTMRTLKSSNYQKKLRKNVEDLKILSNKNNDLLKAIEKEKHKQQELDGKIEEEMKRLLKIEDSKQVSKDKVKKNSENQRILKKLEDQLQLANCRFCKLLEDNKDLRKDIQSLRIQRQRFDELFERIEKKKINHQSDVAEIVRKSTLAHEERNEAQDKLIQLREKSAKDEQRFDSEMKELQRKIRDSRKLLLFLATVDKDREEDAEMRILREKREATLTEKKKLHQLDSLETYVDAWKRIKMATQEDDEEMIISKFLELEEENFALFNFVNNQSRTIEQLQEEINGIIKKIRSFEEGTNQKREEKASIEKFFEERQRSLMGEMGVYEEKNMKIVSLMRKIREKISTIYKSMKVHDDSSMNFDLSLEEEGEVMERNCLKYLVLIEGVMDDMEEERSLGAKQLGSEEDQSQPSHHHHHHHHQHPTFNEDIESLEDQYMMIDLPSMRDKSLATTFAPGFVSMDTTCTENDSEDVMTMIKPLDEIKNSTIRNLVVG